MKQMGFLRPYSKQEGSVITTKLTQKQGVFTAETHNGLLWILGCYGLPAKEGDKVCSMIMVGGPHQSPLEPGSLGLSMVNDIPFPPTIQMGYMLVWDLNSGRSREVKMYFPPRDFRTTSPQIHGLGIHTTCVGPQILQSNSV